MHYVEETKERSRGRDELKNIMERTADRIHETDERNDNGTHERTNARHHGTNEPDHGTKGDNGTK